MCDKPEDQGVHSKDEHLYKIIRDEMIESHNRLSNQRHWTFVIAGVFGVSIVNLLKAEAVDYGLIFILLCIGALANTQLSRYVLNAVSSTYEASAYLFAIEKRNMWKHWNEHLKSFKKEFSISDHFHVVWDAPFLVALVYLLFSVLLARQSNFGVIAWLPVLVCLICNSVVLLANLLEKAEYMRRNYNAIEIEKWMKNPSEAFNDDWENEFEKNNSILRFTNNKNIWRLRRLFYDS